MATGSYYPKSEYIAYALAEKLDGSGKELVRGKFVTWPRNLDAKSEFYDENGVYRKTLGSFADKNSAKQMIQARKRLIEHEIVKLIEDFNEKIENITKNDL